jgi:hypothetical protein
MRDLLADSSGVDICLLQQETGDQKREGFNAISSTLASALNELKLLSYIQLAETLSDTTRHNSESTYGRR